MANLDKVIKGLDICTTRPCYCTDCPYKKDCALDSQELMEDALALLKEYRGAKLLIDEISNQVHDCAKMFRRDDV